jgi:hypothetical protein
MTKNFGVIFFILGLIAGLLGSSIGFLKIFGVGFILLAINARTDLKSIRENISEIEDLDQALKKVRLTTILMMAYIVVGLILINL